MNANYDIFRKETPDSTPVWIETVAGLEPAKRRAKFLASKKPGEYLLWDARNNKYFGVDTR